MANQLGKQQFDDPGPIRTKCEPGANQQATV